MTQPPSGRWVAFPPPETAAAIPPPAQEQAAIPPPQEPAPILSTPPPLYPYPPYPVYPAGPLIDQLKAELSGVAQVTAGLREETKQLVRRAILLYLSYALAINQTMPEAAQSPFRRELLALIRAVGRDIRRDVWEALTRALFYGHQTAASYIPGGTQQDLPDPVNLQWLANVTDATQARLQASLESAVAYAGHGPLGRFDELMASIAPVQAAVEKLDRDVRWATNAAYNQAQRALADAHGMSRMWVAERDACLHCLALSGQIAGPGQPFDGQLTYYIGPLGAPKPLAVYPPGPLWGPPRHPNCRCYQVPVPVLEGYPVMPWESGPTHPSEALQREARRSVAKGMSGSDSMPARLRATSALLAVGARLPKSVEAKARAAVRVGRYR